MGEDAAVIGGIVMLLAVAFLAIGIGAFLELRR